MDLCAFTTIQSLKHCGHEESNSGQSGMQQFTPQPVYVYTIKSIIYISICSLLTRSTAPYLVNDHYFSGGRCICVWGRVLSNTSESIISSSGFDFLARALPCD